MHEDAYTVQVYHVAGGLSKQVRIHRVVSLAKDHDPVGPPTIRSDLLTYYSDEDPLQPPKSRLPGQPIRLALKDPLPRAKDLGKLCEAVEPAVGHRHHNLTAHHAQHCALRSTSGRRRRPCPPRTGVLSSALVPTVLGSAASGPA